ncbi:pyrophosphatase [Tanacetum coccineum]
MYVLVVAALGMLSTIATGLAIGAYGPVSDNVGGITEMAGMSHCIRERTDTLDTARNTIAAIGKGFAIGSAACVSMALFGAFVSKLRLQLVGSVAVKMAEEVRRQFNTILLISTNTSIKEMVPLGAILILTSFVVGIFLVLKQIAISTSNTGAARNNAKKYIEVLRYWKRLKLSSKSGLGTSLLHKLVFPTVKSVGNPVGKGLFLRISHGIIPMQKPSWVNIFPLIFPPNVDYFPQISHVV